MKGATTIDFDIIRKGIVSIHAPNEGSDIMKPIFSHGRVRFNPRSQ